MSWKTSQNSQIKTRSSHPGTLCQKMFLKLLQNSQKGIFASVSLKLQVGNLKLPKGVLKIFASISQENSCIGVFFNKVVILKTVKFAKFLRTTILKNVCDCLQETPTQMFSGEFCELFKNIFFVEHLQMSGSETPVRESLS